MRRGGGWIATPGRVLLRLPIPPVAPVVPVRPAPSAPSTVAPVAPPRKLDFRITLLLQIRVRVLGLRPNFLDALLESVRGIGVRDVGVGGNRTQYRRREHDRTRAGGDDRANPFLKLFPDGGLVGFHRFLLQETHSRIYQLPSKWLLLSLTTPELRCQPSVTLETILRARFYVGYV